MTKVQAAAPSTPKPVAPKAALAAPAKKPAATRSVATDSFAGSTAPKVDLKRGMTGPAVKALQDSLVKLGKMTAAQVATGPGIFGPKTEAALKSFQAQHGVPSTGYYGPLTRAAMNKALAATAPKPKPKPKVDPTPKPGTPAAGGDPRVVKVADDWWHNGHVNPNTGTKEWAGWCLGFVHSAHKAATGHDDPQLRAGTATQAMNQMKAAGRLHTDWSKMKAGAAIFWGTQACAAGHVCIFTGRYDKKGSPICVTTGNWIGANHGVIEEPLSAIERYDGKASGWAQLN